jgi:hypothetical protein
MQREAAYELARSLIGATTILDYLLARVSAWQDDNAFQASRRAVAHVMGNAYFLLRPIWGEYPDLDPGAGGNRLRLPLDDDPPADPRSPADLVPALHRIREIVPGVVVKLARDDRYRCHVQSIRADAEDLMRSVCEAEAALGTADGIQRLGIGHQRPAAEKSDEADEGS